MSKNRPSCGLKSCPATTKNQNKVNHLSAELLGQVERASADRVPDLCAVGHVPAFLVLKWAADGAPETATVEGDERDQVLGFDVFSVQTFRRSRAVQLGPSVGIDLAGDVDATKP